MLKRFNEIACVISDRADALISNPLAFIIFNIFIVALHKTFNVDVANYYISIVTANVLFITAIAGRKRTVKQDKELDAMIDAHPDIDGEQLRDEK